MARTIPNGAQFRTEDETIDTTERRSAKLNDMLEFYTMEDIVGTVSSQITIEGAADASTIFNTAAGMIADASLVDGNVVSTRGYTTAGDGGATVYTVSATGTADGGSVIALTNGLFAVTDFGGTTCATQWGAVKNDVTAAAVNPVSFNAMFLYVATLGGDKCSVNVTTGKYSLGSTVKLPQSIVYDDDRFEINFNGSELRATANDITLLQRDYAYAQESSKVSIYNCNFHGGSMSGVTGIDIQGAYSSQIMNCDFTSLARGIELGFALNSHVYNSKFSSCLRGCTFGLLGGTNGNKQSNVSTMHKCRFYSSKATDYALYIDRVSGVTVEDCIFEGHQPTGANIKFDGQSNVVNDCTIIGCHAESAGHADSGNNTHVEFTGGARLKLYRVFAQSTNTYVDPTNITAGREIINITGGNAYTDLSMYYWTGGFSIRNDVNGYFHMNDEQLNTAMPAQLTWTGAIGEPLYFSLKRAADGLGVQRGRGEQTSDTGGGLTHTHNHTTAGVDTLKGKTWKSWAGSYEGLTDLQFGKNMYNVVNFDQKIQFTNDNHVVGTASHGLLKTPYGQKPNAVTMELEDGETGRHDQTLCPASGRATVYTATAVPTTASDAGKKGEIRSDATHMYICTADNTWIKSALTSF